MKQPKSPIAQALPRGAIKAIALELGLSSPAGSLAIQSGRLGHPAVAAALKIIRESGTAENAQTLALLVAA